MNTGIYLLLDPDVRSPDDWPDILPDILQSRLAFAQLRVKTTSKAYRQRLANLCQEQCARFGVPLLINDDVELAHSSGAAGVHLGQTDGSIAHARSILGDTAIIGQTCHDQLPLVDAAIANGADYASIGALFQSRTKPGAQPAPLSVLQQAVVRSSIPICAIGGINENNVSLVLERGPTLVAVCGGVLRAQNPAEATRRLVRLFADEYQH